MTISIIAAVADNNAIGRGSRLLCCIAEDMERFRRLTLGCAVIMGRKTFESIGKPLAGRTNIVVSRTLQACSGVTIAASLDLALRQCGGDSEVFVIGGESIYRAALPYAQRMYLTQIYARFDADTFFPAFNTADWQEVERTHFDCGKNFPYPFDFIVYEKRNIA